MLRESDILIEFYRVDGYVKVSAVDPSTYCELCRLGDPAEGAEMVRRAALRKLRRVLARMHPANRPC